MPAVRIWITDEIAVPVYDQARQLVAFPEHQTARARSGRRATAARATASRMRRSMKAASMDSSTRESRRPAIWERQVDHRLAQELSAMVRHGAMAPGVGSPSIRAISLR